LNESEVSGLENFHSIRSSLEQILQCRMLHECDILRVLSLQLMGTMTTFPHESSALTDSIMIMQIIALVHSILASLRKQLNSLETYQLITQSGQLIPSSRNQTWNLGGSALSSNEANIWTDKSEPIKSQESGDSFLGGNLNQLIIHLTSSPDTGFLKSFIITYQSFTSPWTLLEKLEQRYNGPPSDKLARMDTQELLKIKLRVCVVLKYWIENQFHDFDPSLIAKLESFVGNTIKQDEMPQMAEMAKRLSAELAKRTHEVRHQRMLHGSNRFSIDLRVPEGGSFSPVSLFMRFNESEIARQLTVLDFAVFKQIKVQIATN